MNNLLHIINDVYINPLLISRIKWVGGKRYGGHPYKNKLWAKQPWYVKIWGQPVTHSTWYAPEVIVLGTGGNRILTIECESNQHAEELSLALEHRFDEALDKFGRVGKG